MATDVKIDIAAEYTGKKAFSQADKQVSMLIGQVKKLAGAFGITFGAAALARYGQNAVKAFAGAELEISQLNNSVRNLGLAFASKDLDIYLNKVEALTGINRNQLQPAMLKLLQVTGSVEKSQELLNLAMDVAAGTNQDLTSTSEKLSQAYVGNFKGLRSLNLGLTQAELASSSFEDVQKRLQVLFAGQASTAANSYIGSMNKLAVASENASEKIGKSLIGALTAISGGDTVDDTVKKIDTLSSAIAGLIDVTVGLKAGEYLKQYYALKSGSIAGGFGNRSMSVLGQDTQKSDLAARQKAETDAKKRAAELLAAQKKTLKSQQDALKLAKARAVFDLQKIQIEAALKGKISEEDRIRLKLMQAIEDENISQIEIYTKLLDSAQKNTEKLVSTLQGIKPLDDIFKNWNFMSVKEQLASLETYFKNFAGSAASAFNALSQAQQASLGGYRPFVGASNASLGITSNGGATTSMPSTVGLGTSGTGNQLPAGVTINNNINTGIGDPNAIAEAIDDVLTQASRRGTLRGLLAI